MIFYSRQTVNDSAPFSFFRNVPSHCSDVTTQFPNGFRETRQLVFHAYSKTPLNTTGKWIPGTGGSVKRKNSLTYTHLFSLLIYFAVRK